MGHINSLLQLMNSVFVGGPAGSTALLVAVEEDITWSKIY